MSFFEHVSHDAWIQSIGTIIGAFMGALTAGIITIKSHQIERKRAENEDRVEQLNTFISFYTGYKPKLDEYMTVLRRISIVTSQTTIDKNAVINLLTELSELVKTDRQFDVINLLNLPSKVMMRIQVIRKSIKNIVQGALIDIESMNEDKLKNIQSNVDRIFRYCQDLEDMDQAAIIELKEMHKNKNLINLD